MSGIEIAGIVLAAFPLLISIFEHYEDVAKAKGLLTGFQDLHLKSMNDIKDEEALFKVNIEILLLPLVADGTITQSEMEQLLAEIGGPRWEDEDLQEALSHRLGTISVRYMKIMQDMQAAIWKLSDAMGVNNPRFQDKLNQRLVRVPQ